MEVTRRSFLKGAALGTAAAAAAGMLGCTTAELSHTDGALPEWNHEADVVVVGFGAAGASAAYEAANAGGSVIILEKQPEDTHHPSTRMSGGVVMVVNDAENAASYMQYCAGDSVPEALTKAWAQEATGILDRLAEIGFDGELDFYQETGEHVEFEHAEAVSAIRLTKGLNAELLWELLSESVERDGVEVLWETPAVELVYRKGADGANEVLGVRATNNGEDVFVKARKGVLLSCGGYEFNDKLKSFLPTAPVYFYGNPDNTGDGVLMAQAVGAQLWHMNKMVGRGIGYCGDMGFIIGISPAPYLIVDQKGQRYMNEDLEAKLNHAVYYDMIQFNAAENAYVRNPSWWIFDQTRMDAGPLTYATMGAVGVGLYDWSSDNTKELDAGWIIKGETIEELAGKLGMVAADLQATIDAYNAACAAGADDLGRSSESLIEIKPPYYAFPLYPGGPNSSGGPERNENAQILNVWGEPIPRLYGAGELGQAIGNLYPAGGGDISEAMCFGNIAGRNIVALEAWDGE